jgi:hypothetical protein
MIQQVSPTHRVRDSVKALTREQEKLLGQLKEVQADKEQNEVRGSEPLFMKSLLRAGHQQG